MIVDTKAYAIRLKNEKELNSSSSGGAFTALSDVFINNGGAVISSVYNYQTFQTEFMLYDNIEMRDTARGSKYMQSYLLNIFNDAIKWLKNNEGSLLFIGVGCQADGFRKFIELKGLRERVLIVDIICHGSSSPMIWRDYAKMKDPFTDLTFRDKRNGWKKPTAHISVNGKEKSVQDYLTIFYNKCALRPSCYECPYATIKRNVDLTIGDYWGIEKALPDFEIGNGVSLILVHTEKGQEIFEAIKDKVEWSESNTADCLQPNLIKPTERSTRREEFWADYQNGGISFILKKYAPQPSFLRRCVRKAKRILKGHIKR